MLAAIALRLVAFPAGHAPPESDEVGYLGDGLLLLEGITPAYKFVPAGVLTWFTAMIGGIDAAWRLIAGGAAFAAVPGMLKPIAALEATLFAHYADLSSLRLVTVGAIVVLSCVTALLAARRALVAGALAASFPMFVEMSTEARPYAIAWSLALLALLVAQREGRGRVVGAGILVGLAVGTRIDMVMVGPLVLLLQWRAAGGRPPWRDFALTILVAALAFVVIAPWYLTHLLGNLRYIISVRMLDPRPPPGAPPIWLTFWQEGLMLPAMAALAGLAAAAWYRRWPEALAGAWLLLLAVMALKPSPFGLRHDGALVVATVGLMPIALHALGELVSQNRRAVAMLAIGLAVVAPAFAIGASDAWYLRRAHAPDQAVAWIERNVPPGTRIYITDRIDVPLPTPEAADRIWALVARPDAWRDKLRLGLDRFGLGGGPVPRALSEEHIHQERGAHRRFYILGASISPSRPRYDLHVVSDGGRFDVPLAEAARRICAEGGVLLHHGEPIAGLPAPAASWQHAPGGSVTRIHVVTQPGSCRPG
ncbi:MAG: glycosyltransferase family 39 protein [Alphaproteobacteria bacterium]|nr:glycosyltransferase family 39 protein [Alphaproteobacteria bacterium]MCW5741544.1 glycosyltransferase family 39 protein [Alphaproteobacteria bacterium]